MSDILLDDDQSNAMRIVLVGKTGSGKSATANTILGERKFESKISAISVTRKCQRAFRKWKGKNILVVDTPGLFDTLESLDTTYREIRKCALYSSPGPHAVILVLALSCYTELCQEILAMIKAVFGEEVTRHMIVLFTHKEDLEGKSLSDFLAGTHVNLRNLVKECGNRCCAFSNRAGETEKEVQVQELVELIERMILSSGHFTDKIYEDVDRRLTQKAKELVKFYDAQLQKEIKLVEQYASKPQEKEKKIKLLREKHADQIRNIRKEAEQKLCDDIFSGREHTFMAFKARFCEII